MPVPYLQECALLTLADSATPLTSEEVRHELAYPHTNDSLSEWFLVRVLRRPPAVERALLAIHAEMPWLLSRDDNGRWSATAEGRFAASLMTRDILRDSQR